ncbi:hypothetical protein ACAX43_02325 [Paraburkholderia sp. IW21]|uniref:hypothetical protein n=1 Tax=Paraburkholderia sp. IW21 TaxID=3242488 RepID=UPI00351FF859
MPERSFLNKPGKKSNTHIEKIVGEDDFSQGEIFVPEDEALSQQFQAYIEKRAAINDDHANELIYPRAYAVARKISQNGEWASEAGDMAPSLIVCIPGASAAGLRITILDEDDRIVLHDERGSTRLTDITLRRVNRNHYQAVVEGIDKDIPADGNCFFAAVWEALQGDEFKSARNCIFQRKNIQTSQQASNYFRFELANYIRQRASELEDGISFDVIPFGRNAVTDALMNGERGPRQEISPAAIFKSYEAGRILSPVIDEQGESNTDDLSPSLQATATCQSEEDANLFLVVIKRLLQQVMERLIDSALKKGKAVVVEYMTLPNQISLILGDPSQRFPEKLKAINALIKNREGNLPDFITVLPPWLDLANEAWSLEEIDRGRSVEENIRTISYTAQTLLTDPLVSELLSSEQATRFRTLLQQGSQAATLLTKLRKLPSEATFGDYFDLLKDNSLFRSIAPASVLSLVKLADQLHQQLDAVAFPPEKDERDRLDWLTNLLISDAGVELLASQVDLTALTAVKTPIALVKLFKQYPGEADGLAQLDWLTHQLLPSNGTSPLSGTLLEPMVGRFQDSLGDSKEIMRITRLLLKIASPQTDRKKELPELLRLIFTPSRGAKLASFILPYFPTLLVTFNAGKTFYESGKDVYELREWYSQVSPGQSWQATSKQFAAKISDILGKDAKLLASLSGFSVGSIQATGSAVYALFDWSWEKTVAWLLEQMKLNSQGRWYYDRMLEVCLVWQLYQAFKPGTASAQAHTALRNVAVLLKSYLPEINTATFDTIIQVLPLLPGLVALKSEGHKLPPSDDWIEWLHEVVGLTGTSTNPAVKRFAEQVESVARKIGDDILQRLFDSVTANAAALFGETPPTHEMLDATPPSFAPNTRTAEQLLITTLAQWARIGVRKSRQQLGAMLASAGTTLNSILLQGGEMDLLTSPFGPIRMSPLSDVLTVLRLGVIEGADLAGESTGIAPELKNIIWGNNELASQKKIFSIALSVYFISIIAAFVIYKKYKAGKDIAQDATRYDPVALNESVSIPMEPANGGSVMPTPTEQGNLLPQDEGAEISPAPAERDRAQPEANTLSGRARKGLTGIWCRMKENPEEPALGVALFVGLGATAHFVEKYVMNKQNVNVDEVVDQVSFIDVAADDDFSKAFVAPSIFIPRHLSADSTAMPGEKQLNNIRKYTLELARELGDSWLKQFFTHLMGKLQPTLFAMPELMKKTENNYAFLLQLDLMLLTMQAFIVEELKKNNYTNLEGLLALNRVRNLVIKTLFGEYKSQVIPYYKALSAGKLFNTVKAFWLSNILKTYLRYALHSAGHADDKIETYVTTLNTMQAEQLLISDEYHQGIPIGIAGERHVIKVLMDELNSILDDNKYDLARAQRKQSENNNSEKIDGYRLLIRTFETLIDALSVANQQINENPFLNFTYPQTEEEYVNISYVNKRLAEIIGKSLFHDSRIAIAYIPGENEDEKIYFSLQQIAFGDHIKYPQYEIVPGDSSRQAKDNVVIFWPAIVDNDARRAILDICGELEDAKNVIEKMKKIREAKINIDEAKFVNVTGYAQELIDEEAKKLGITGTLTLGEKIEIKMKGKGVRVAGHPFPEDQEWTEYYILGELIFNKNNELRPALAKNKEDKLLRLAVYLQCQDLQSLYLEKINRWKDNEALKKDFDLLTQANVKPILVGTAGIDEVRYMRIKLVGLLRYINKTGTVNIISLLDQSSRTFSSDRIFNAQFNVDEELWKWMLQHSTDPLAQSSEAKRRRKAAASRLDDARVSVPLIRPSDFLAYEKITPESYSYYSDYLDRLSREADLLATSDSELFWDNFLEVVKVVAWFVSLATFPLGMLASFAIGLALGITPPLLQVAIADDPDKKQAHLFEAALSLLFETVGAGIGQGGSVIIKRLKKSMEYRRLFSYRLLIDAGRSIDDIDTGPLPLVVGDGFSILPDGESNILKSARKLIHSTSEGTCRGVCWNFAMQVLKDSKAVDAQVVSDLERIVGNLAQNKPGVSINDLFKGKESRLISESQELTAVPEGQLIIFSEPAGEAPGVKHVAVSVGNGRFAGMKNDYLDPALGPGKSIVTAEEFGQFIDGRFLKRGAKVGTIEPALEVRTGYPQGSALAATAGEGGQNRVIELLGQDGLFSLNPQSGELFIDAHGYPFTINHLDSDELYHIIRGLAYHKGFVPTDIKSILLKSCYGADGGKYSSAAMLANQFDVGFKVRAYKGTVSRDYQRVHPNGDVAFASEVAGALKIKLYRQLHKFAEEIIALKQSGKKILSEIDPAASFLQNLIRLIKGGIILSAFKKHYKQISASDYEKLSSIVSPLARDVSDEDFIDAVLKIMFNVEGVGNAIWTEEFSATGGRLDDYQDKLGYGATPTVVPEDAPPVLIGPYERSRWNREVLWRTGEVLKLFAKADKLLAKADNIVEIQLTGNIKKQHVTFSVEKNFDYAGNLTYSLYTDDGKKLSRQTGLDDVFSAYADQNNDEYRSFVKEIFSQGEDVKFQIVYSYKERKEDEGKVFASDIYDRLPAPSGVGTLDPDNIVGDNDARLNELATSERIQDRARKVLLADDKQDNLALIDVFFYLISQAPCAPDDILNLRRPDELPQFMKLVASSVQVAVILNAMVQTDELDYTKEDLSITAIGWFMCRLSRIIFREYSIDIDAISELDPLHKIDHIAYQMSRLPLSLSNPHRTVSYWLALFNQFDDRMIGSSNIDASSKSEVLIGPYKSSRWNRAMLWQTGTVLRILQRENHVSRIQLFAKIKNRLAKFTVSKTYNKVGNLAYKFSTQNDNDVFESVAVDDVFSVYADKKDDKYYRFVANIFEKGSGVKYKITYISNKRGEDEGPVVDNDIYDKLLPVEEKILSPDGGAGRNDALLESLTDEGNIIERARVALSIKDKEKIIYLLDVFFYLIAQQVPMDLLDDNLNLQREDQFCLFMRQVACSVKIATFLNSMAVTGKADYADADLSAAAIGRFMRRLSILILPQYGVDIAGIAECDPLRRIEKIADQIRDTVSNEAPRRTPSYWLALFSQYRDDLIGSATTTTSTTTKEKQAVTLGPGPIDSVRRVVRFTNAFNETIMLNYDKGELSYKTPFRMKIADISKKIYRSTAEINDLMGVNAEVFPLNRPVDADIPAGTEIKLPGLYLTRPGDTLRSIAKNQLFYRGHARQLAYLNRDLRVLEESGVVKNKVEFTKNAVVEDNIDINKPIPEDIVIKLPFVVKMDRKMSFDLFEPDLFKIFYGPESYDDEIEAWNKIGLYEGGVGIYDQGAKKMVWYYLGPR